MPLYTQVHVDKLLTNLTLEFPQQMYMSDDLFPVMTVDKKSDKYAIWDADKEYARAVDDTIQSGAAAKMVSRSVTNATFDTEGHALADFISIEENSNADPAIQADLRVGTTQFLVEKLMVNKEIEAKTILDAGISATAAADAGWDQDTSKPVVDITTAINTIETAAGKTPNIMAMDTLVFRALQNHPDIVERVQAGGGVRNDNPAQATLAGIEELFGISVVLSSAVKNTAVEGQSASNSRVWSDTVYFAFNEPNPGRRIYTMGMGFQWLGAGVASNGFRILVDPSVNPEGEMIIAKKYYDQKVTAAAAGYRLTNALQA
jgi:hypothetical protein